METISTDQQKLYRERNFNASLNDLSSISSDCWQSRPRWLSWMRRPTGDQEVAGSTPAEVGNILS